MNAVVLVHRNHSMGASFFQEGQDFADNPLVLARSVAGSFDADNLVAGLLLLQDAETIRFAAAHEIEMPRIFKFAIVHQTGRKRRGKRGGLVLLFDHVGASRPQNENRNVVGGQAAARENRCSAKIKTDHLAHSAVLAACLHLVTVMG